MKEIIEKYKNVIIQISTPDSTGTGFYLNDYNVIVTNDHVVRGSNEVIIDGKTFDKQMSKVFFNDTRYDLAFIEAPDTAQFDQIGLASDRRVTEGDQVLALGHPYGLKYTATQGIVSKAERNYNDVNYIQVDAAINPGNSGGPLISEEGEVVGVNTFIISGSNNLGFALPANYLKDTLDAYRPHLGQKAIKCHSCETIVTNQTIEDEYCPNCGAKLDKKIFEESEKYEATGIAKTIETIITKLGKDVNLSRRGKNNWEIEEGSATINLSYSEQSYFVIGDAHLCRLPKQNIGPIYEFLLKENFTLEDVTFSVRGTDIILSVLIYDKYLNEDTGMRMMENLFKKADHYDNILVEQYGAIWKHQDED